MCSLISFQAPLLQLLWHERCSSHNIVHGMKSKPSERQMDCTKTAVPLQKSKISWAPLPDGNKDAACTVSTTYLLRHLSSNNPTLDIMNISIKDQCLSAGPLDLGWLTAKAVEQPREWERALWENHAVSTSLVATTLHHVAKTAPSLLFLYCYPDGVKTSLPIPVCYASSQWKITAVYSVDDYLSGIWYIDCTFFCFETDQENTVWGMLVRFLLTLWPNSFPSGFIKMILPDLVLFYGQRIHEEHKLMWHWNARQLNCFEALQSTKPLKATFITSAITLLENIDP